MKKLLFVVLALLIVVPIASRADINVFPESLSAQVLSETVPTAFSQGDIGVADYGIDWRGNPLAGVNARLGGNSFEWVRVAEVLSLPRARLLLSIDDIEGGSVMNAGFTQPIAVQAGKGSAELPVALISGEKNPINIVIKRHGVEYRGELLLRFHPQRKHQNLIFTDPSCSPFRMVFDVKGESMDDWMYIGCRYVYVEGDEHKAASLEAFVFWDNVGQKVKIDDFDTQSTSHSVWPLRLRSKPGRVTMTKDGKAISFSYIIPERAHFGSLGVGIGPYTYTFDSPGASVNTIAPVVTLYGSYFVLETVRLAAFNATVINSVLNTDTGFYVIYESLKTLDRRISVNLMLGGHTLGYRTSGENKFSLSAPQGFELVFRDAGLKGHNIFAGAFLYPPIQGKSYYNVWIRWGTSSLFGELNYISWQEKFTEDNRVFSRSLGISFGVPLARFL
jgi:hypothetical protein